MPARRIRRNEGARPGRRPTWSCAGAATPAPGALPPALLPRRLLLSRNDGDLRGTSWTWPLRTSFGLLYSEHKSRVNRDLRAMKAVNQLNQRGPVAVIVDGYLLEMFFQ